MHDQVPVLEDACPDQVLTRDTRVWFGSGDLQGAILRRLKIRSKIKNFKIDVITHPWFPVR